MYLPPRRSGRARAPAAWKEDAPKPAPSTREVPVKAEPVKAVKPVPAPSARKVPAPSAKRARREPVTIDADDDDDLCVLPPASPPSSLTALLLRASPPPEDTDAWEIGVRAPARAAARALTDAVARRNAPAAAAAAWSLCSLPTRIDVRLARCEENMLALFNAFTAGAVDAAAIASTAAMAVLDGVAPQGAAAWRGLAPPLCAAWLDDVAAVATAPRAVWNLLAALAHTRGGDVPVVAAFAFGRGAGGGAVSVRYTREAGGRAVHVEVEGMAAHRLHVGVVSGTRGGAVAYWRTVCPYPSADCDAATFDAAVAAAQAEVARMELRCACPASDAAVNAAILWRRGTPCACAGGLGAAATRHAVLVDACPLTRARGGLAREWWGWHADAPPPRAPLATAAAAAAATFVRGLTWHACAARGSWRDVPALPHVAAAVGDDRASSTCAWCGVTVAHEAAPLTVEDAWAAFQRAVARGGAL